MNNSLGTITVKSENTKTIYKYCFKNPTDGQFDVISFKPDSFKSRHKFL